MRLLGIHIMMFAVFGCVNMDQPDFGASEESSQEARSYVAPGVASRSPGDASVPPFSGAVQIGSTLYISGTLGLDENRQVPDRSCYP